MGEKLTAWQAFELANKWYLIILGIFMLGFGLVSLFIFSLGGIINIILGIICLGIGMISKVSTKKSK